MKVARTKTIEKILSEFQDSKQKEITQFYEQCFKQICCEDIQWKKFECFIPSCEMMKEVLSASAPEYIMAIADIINQQENTGKTVRITFINTKAETSIYTINQNGDTILVYISLSKEIRKQLKNSNN